ncbi:hypothetical protein ACLI09_03690 [Flavobacterium sp. RHBU_24]|uniref:hypothetical protein n=1 Tax=Flavobacterium sp. RHBU_24 TaxID=3391185 RepID=UPI00398510A1
MKKIVCLLAFFTISVSFAQIEKINNYKYIIVPDTFEFLKETNKYNLNTLTRMMFEKAGFTVFMSNEQLPPELANNRCRALYGSLDSKSGMLRTKINIEIKDCYGTVLYTSEEGISREKDFQKAYYQSLREAAKSFYDAGYAYVGDAASNAYFQQGQAVTPPTVPVTPVAPAAVAPATLLPAVAATVPGSQLFAQPIANGYQLVDTTPKVVLKMYKTSQPDSYTAVSDTKNGVVFKKGNDWYFEYYLNDTLVSEKLDIKF